MAEGMNIGPKLLNKVKGTAGSFPNGPALAAELQAWVYKHGGCKPNICFALDGSGSITQKQWRAQKDFVLLAAAVIGVDRSAEFAAVEYGLRLDGISLLTRNVNKFLRKVDRERLNRASATFLASGIAYCHSQLSQRPYDANKMVILGDGRNTFGSNPVPLAQKFLNSGNTAICAVGVGYTNTAVLNAITGDPSRVYTTNEWDGVVGVLRQLVIDVCELPPMF